MEESLDSIMKDKRLRTLEIYKTSTFEFIIKTSASIFNHIYSHLKKYRITKDKKSVN